MNEFWKKANLVGFFLPIFAAVIRKNANKTLMGINRNKVVVLAILPHFFSDWQNSLQEKRMGLLASVAILANQK